MRDEWANDALCAQTDPDIFTPPAGGSTRPAKKICGNCEVRLQCLEWAMSTPGSRGILGGLTEAERRKLRQAS